MGVEFFRVIKGCSEEIGLNILFLECWRGRYQGQI